MVFYKSCSGGNDFLQVDAAELSGPPSPTLVRCWCDRHYGAGADGLVVYDRSVRPVSFRIFNQDGLEAELSGNGMAGLSALLCHLGANGDTIELAGIRDLYRHRLLDGRDNGYHLRIDLGLPDFADSRLFPFLNADQQRRWRDGFYYRSLRFYPVAVGNPQVVFFQAAGQSTAEVLALAEELHRQPIFPQRTNVSIITDRGDDGVGIRFYERGVGATLSSSTGTAGAYAVLRALEPGLSELVFLPPSGEKIKISGCDRIFIENRTRIVYKGEYLESGDE